MHFLTASHFSISYLSPPLGGTFTRARIEDPPMRRKRAIWRYMWYVYRLAGGTATLLLVHLPASFSDFTNEIQAWGMSCRR